jgi:hypothetical protein
MKWITREHPKIDRIACPWLLLRFIDAQSEFHYVPADRVLAMAKEMAHNRVGDVFGKNSNSLFATITLDYWSLLYKR